MTTELECYAMLQVFAERYRLQFITIPDSDKDSVASMEDDDEGEDDSDLYEMAVEDIEIDQSSELYQTIAEGIIKSVSIVEEDNLGGAEPVKGIVTLQPKPCQQQTKDDSSDSNNGWEDVGSEEK